MILPSRLPFVDSKNFTFGTETTPWHYGTVILPTSPYMPSTKGKWNRA